MLPLFNDPSAVPLYKFINGVVYKTGYKQSVALPGDADLETWLHQFCKTACVALGVAELEIAPEVVAGMVLITVMHAPIAVGRRARGSRGGKRVRQGDTCS